LMLMIFFVMSNPALLCGYASGRNVDSDNRFFIVEKLKSFRTVS